MGKKSSPAPPDYAAAAAASGEASKEVAEQQTWANRPTQITPMGRVDWYNQPVWDPTSEQYINRWSQVTSLNEPQQRALDSQQRIGQGRSDLAESLLGRTYDEYGDIVDWDNFSPKGSRLSPNEYNAEDIQRSLDFSGARDFGNIEDVRNRSEDALYDRGAARLDPRFAQEEDNLRTMLANQGLAAGDTAYDEQMRQFNERKDDQYSQLRNDSIAFGGDEATRQFGMGLQGRQQDISEIMSQGGFANNAANQALAQQLSLGSARFGEEQSASAYDNQLRQQDISEELQKRGWSLNEINAILTGQQIGMPSMPGFNSATRAESADYLGAAGMQNQANMDAFSADQAGMQGLMSGVASIAPYAMALSDRRLKRNIQKLFRLTSGLMVYSFEYIWGEKAVGVMAQECATMFPEAVHRHPSGYLMVDYGAVS